MKKHYLKNTRFARSAVKESIDNLPMGLCFSDRFGRLILINQGMIRLSHSVTGKEVQDADEFWQTIGEGVLKDGTERLKYGASPILRLPDGTVWAFFRHVVNLNGESVTQMTASNITELDEVRIQLNDANDKLKDMNDRLRQYGKDIVEVTAQEERLATKVHIHDELGHVLLATRHYLLENEGDEVGTRILDIWKRDISVLRGSAEAELRTPITSIENAAEALGVVLRIEGELPKGKYTETLILAAVSEALNNAVRHAGAKKLTVLLSQTASQLSVRISNDGVLPKSEIHEGGGLSTLRRRLEATGGTLTISIVPAFQMLVTIPLSEEVSLL